MSAPHYLGHPEVTATCHDNAVVSFKRISGHQPDPVLLDCGGQWLSKPSPAANGEHQRCPIHFGRLVPRTQRDAVFADQLHRPAPMCDPRLEVCRGTLNDPVG